MKQRNIKEKGAGSVAQADFSGDVRSGSVSDALLAYRDRLRGGDMGALPATAGLLVLVAIFTSMRPDDFLSFGNMANLLTQGAAVCVLAMGLIPVLLIGEIDLSAAVTGAMFAAVMALMINDGGLNSILAIAIATAMGAVFGVIIGILVTRLGIPSFVVTLALFLAVQGMILKLIGARGTVAIREPIIVGVANSNLPILLGWLLAVVVIAAFAISQFGGLIARKRRKVYHQPLPLVVLKVAALALIVLGMTAALSANRALIEGSELKGVPYVVPIVLVLLVIWTFVFDRTRYGRHIYAVGGNPEAARRAGINVPMLRISVFAICSGMAVLSAVITASRLNSVAPASGAGNTLLYAIGAAVIGGTSLFGGRGKMRDAIIGGLVIAVIDNGLGLLGYDAYVNYIVTGGVLLLAASVDAASRRRRSTAGR
ncbi:MAG: sugar ABC transporter permease [Angustibacter sp.]